MTAPTALDVPAASAARPASAVPAALIRIDSPVGRILIVGDGEAVTGLDIATDDVLPFDDEPERPDAVLARAADQLAEYFAGTRTVFDVPLHRRRGTPFQEAVWDYLQTVPFGTAVPYGRIGEAVGIGPVGRAVGGAVGANPIPLLIPCHRVLASDGRITGYSCGNGIPTKVQLLDHEGIPHR